VLSKILATAAMAAMLTVASPMAAHAAGIGGHPQPSKTTASPCPSQSPSQAATPTPPPSSPAASTPVSKSAQPVPSLSQPAKPPTLAVTGPSVGYLVGGGLTLLGFGIALAVWVRRRPTTPRFRA
jgi:hypothetical protein